MDLSSIHWDQIAAAALSGGLFSKAIALVNQKNRSQAYTMGAVDHAVETAMKSVTQEVGRLNEQVISLRAQHENCEAELTAASRERETLRLELKHKIDEMMRGPTAAYPNGGGG